MYVCSFDGGSSYATCQAETDICPALEAGSSVDYRVDTSYEYYLNNWYVEMDLVCASKVKTNFMISAQYIAYGIAGLLLFPMPDRFGRKASMLINFGVHLVAQYVIIFMPSYQARLIGFLFYGLSQLKNSVVYVYAVELVPARRSGPVNISLTSFDSATMAIVCLYFLLISKDWFPLCLGMMLLSTVSFLGIVFLLPESPIWLLQQGRVQDAIAAFNRIGKINRSAKRIPEDAVFREVAKQDNRADTEVSQASGPNLETSRNLSRNNRFI